MPDIDWVKERSECSLARVFRKLQLQVEEDVVSKNALRPQNAQHKFLTTSFTTRFTVFIEGVKADKSVKFELAETEITVTDSEGNVMFTAGLTLNKDGECRMKVHDEEYEFWQIRKMALEKLFFETV